MSDNEGAGARFMNFSCPVIYVYFQLNFVDLMPVNYNQRR